MPKKTSRTTDHRPRVAAERRERMRRRLVESAMLVFAQKGVTSSVIQDVVAAAEVSQGSFYNYFRTNDELLNAVARELSDETVEMIEPVVGGIDDPALRVSNAIRSYLHLMRTYRVAAHFVSAAGLNLATTANATYSYLPPDLEEGRESGRFDIPAVDVAVDLIAGAGLVAVHRIAIGRTPRDYPERIVSALLRALGLRAADAARITAAPLPKVAVPPDSLLARAQARFVASTQNTEARG